MKFSLLKVCWIGKRFIAHASSISYSVFYQLVCHDLFWLQHWAPHSLPKFSGLKLRRGIWSCRICKFCFHWRVISRTIDSSLCPIDGSWSEFSSSWALRLCYRRSLTEHTKVVTPQLSFSSSNPELFPTSCDVIGGSFFGNKATLESALWVH